MVRARSVGKTRLRWLCLSRVNFSKAQYAESVARETLRKRRAKRPRCRHRQLSKMIVSLEIVEKLK